MPSVLPSRFSATGRVFLVLFAAALSFPATVRAQEKDLGQFTDWQAHTYSEGGGKVCNMWSRPKKHEEGGKKRDDIFAFVTHRPDAGGRRDEVSVEMGYPVDPEKSVTVRIGSKTWSFFALGTSAFARATDDKEIVKAMRAGARMTVEAISARGTKTKDTYSLSGFTKAHRAINKACGF